MKDHKTIHGFSKLSKQHKIGWLVQQGKISAETAGLLSSFELQDEIKQEIIASLSENQISNYHLPFTIAPNFLINKRFQVLPLVTEESSVVAALAKAAGFWAKRGGFHTQVTGTVKKGQLHFIWTGNPDKLQHHFAEIKQTMLKDTEPITINMKRRGGGILHIQLKYLPDILPDYYQIDASFDTRNAMGANFINSCLEQFGKSLAYWLSTKTDWPTEEQSCEIIMAILSNYVPESQVKVWAECPVEALSENNNQEEAVRFAEKFVRAVHISRHDLSRAVTHNKGIFNGIDALALATGNDFRAIEAGGHAFAARNGSYAGLSEANLTNGVFNFSMEISLSVGVVGGVTALHPLSQLAMQILGNPTAEELMGYMAVAGLASNWSAVRALVTTGIQHGHMRMHLSNILNTFQATEEQKQAAQHYFQNREVSFSAVKEFLKHGQQK